MTEQGFGRRDFLKGAVVGGAAAATEPRDSRARRRSSPRRHPRSPSPAAGYEFLNLDEAPSSRRWSIT